MHIGKYFKYIFRGAIKILFYPFQARKYVKNKDNYPLEERINFVKVRINDVIDNILKVKVEVEGLEKLNDNETYLFVPNHQGMLDPLCLIKILSKPTIFVSKKEARKMPIIGKLNYIMDSIFLDRESPRDALNMVKQCREYLKNNTNVVIFPEGTRSKDKDVTIHEYKPGALKCAYGTNAKIVPVVIDKSYIPLSTKVKNDDGIVKVKFLAPISSQEYETLNTLELAQKIEKDAKLSLEIMRKSA